MIYIFFVVVAVVVVVGKNVFTRNVGDVKGLILDAALKESLRLNPGASRVVCFGAGRSLRLKMAFCFHDVY